MPLRDHFHAPFTDRRNWDEVHGMWPAVIVQHLADQLPPEYFAAPKVHLGRQFEIDVGTFDAPSDQPRGLVEDPGGGAATVVWAPPEPTMLLDAELPDVDEYEVLIHHQDGRRLVAAIELISPSNKDRPETRKQFATKCAALLLNEVCVVLIDVITSRQSNLYSDLLSQVNQNDPALGDEPPATYAVTSRWCPRGKRGRFESWYHPVSPGSKLPVLPVWLDDTSGVLLDLETTYEQTCRTLRIV
ncbi:MAG: DUF4058 family protein [Planctomycetota bacterium]|nr:DUF4058 family protein [Planctomycetota bacterium]